jgi:hypothetical protein
MDVSLLLSSFLKLFSNKYIPANDNFTFVSAKPSKYYIQYIYLYVYINL